MPVHGTVRQPDVKAENVVDLSYVGCGALLARIVAPREWLPHWSTSIMLSSAILSISLL